MSIVFYLERTNQLSLLPDKDLVGFSRFMPPYRTITSNEEPFVGWVSGSVTHAGVGFHAST
ncbi:MAG: hypothetical protein GPI90_16690 [Microcystis aeruginosa K13-05]|nr:hypothetical protein [Microcystis aeruginosa K13-05]